MLQLEKSLLEVQEIQKSFPQWEAVVFEDHRLGGVGVQFYEVIDTSIVSDQYRPTEFVEFPEMDLQEIENLTGFPIKQQ